VLLPLGTEVAVSTVSDYRPADSGSIPSRGKGFFSPSLYVQMSSKAHPASYPMATGVFSPEVNRGQGVTLTTHPPSSAEIKNEELNLSSFPPAWQDSFTILLLLPLLLILLLLLLVLLLLLLLLLLLPLQCKPLFWVNRWCTAGNKTHVSNYYLPLCLHNRTHSTWQKPVRLKDRQKYVSFSSMEDFTYKLHILFKDVQIKK
jgi:hypothetical protein